MQKGLKLKPLAMADPERLVKMMAPRFAAVEPCRELTEGAENGGAYVEITLRPQVETLCRENLGWALEDERGMVAGWPRHKERPLWPAWWWLRENRLVRDALEAGVVTKEDMRIIGQNAKKLGLGRPDHWQKRVCSGPYQYMLLGCVDEGLKGTGAFRLLFDKVLDKADAIGLPVLLDTYVPGNVQIYEHFGFFVAEENEKGGLVKYCMMRPPQKERI